MGLKMILKMKNSKYYKLCAKTVSGEISPEEKHNLDEWLGISPENHLFFENIKSAWDHTEPIPVPSIPDTDREWSHLEHSLEVDTGLKKDRPFFPVFQDIVGVLTGFIGTRFRPVVYSFATILILVVGFLFLKNQFSRPHFQEIITYHKQKTVLNLSDGSRIHLNSGSSIKYPRTFSDTIREVILAGEAFFEVTHDERRFIVITENARTTVLGTAFNVRARDKQTRVIVKEGRVELSSINTDKENVILSKGQMSQITGSVTPQEPRMVDVDHLLGWMEDRLVFEKTPLMEIVTELERYYDVTIEVDTPQLDQQTITGVFEDSPIETVLSSICITLDAQYRFENEKYIITDKP